MDHTIYKLALLINNKFYEAICLILTRNILNNTGDNKHPYMIPRAGSRGGGGQTGKLPGAQHFRGPINYLRNIFFTIYITKINLFIHFIFLYITNLFIHSIILYITNSNETNKNNIIN